jgi:hypothetical protein
MESEIRLTINGETKTLVQRTDDQGWPSLVCESGEVYDSGATHEEIAERIGGRQAVLEMRRQNA